MVATLQLIRIAKRGSGHALEPLCLPENSWCKQAQMFSPKSLEFSLFPDMGTFYSYK